MDTWKNTRWEGSEKRRKEVRRSEKKKTEKKADAGAQKGRKVVIYCVFPMVCGSGKSNRRLAKAAGADPSGQMRKEKLHALVARSTFRIKMHKILSFETSSKKCTQLWREAHFQVKMYKAHPHPTTFWKLRNQKIARPCGAKHVPNQNEQNASASEHFWKL